MEANSISFESHRLKVAQLFAHTMIVIDDQASQQESEGMIEQAPGIKRPGRRAARESAERQEEHSREIQQHSLDAKALIDNAMELGLICSVLRPKQGEDLRERVRKAAEHADIVCLDWEIYNDDGETAKAVISEIVRSDAEKNGRLRLIAIYTGERNRQKILNEVLSIFSEEERQKQEIKKNQNAVVVNRDGLRIVYLFKRHGTMLSGEVSDYQVSEEELPERLQMEFSQLSRGLLSNVALATIASIRHVAHHVVGKFSSRMDGPYFHHRAMIPSPDDAENYAIEIVLSELKNAIDKQKVADIYAGKEAVEARIRNIAGNRNQLRLSYEDGEQEKHYDLDIGDVVKMVVDGCETSYTELKVKPPKRRMKEAVSSLFGNGLDGTMAYMKEFASLTGVRAHPGNYLLGLENNYPVLGLGSIVQDMDKHYWICLQASCDSVRLKKATAFLFVPLGEEKAKPEVVVPVLSRDGVVEFLGLRLEKAAYNQATSVLFTPDNRTQTVRATKIRGRKGFYFMSIEHKNYLWLADLKHRRALRIAQRLGQDMGRLGFDEFEPFRQYPGDIN